jgi:predicted membrane chloride channel (bestrophin family)
MTAYSIFYHRLKKLALEINYYSKVMAFRKHNEAASERRQNEKHLWGELLESLDKLYQETAEDIKAISNEPKHMGSLQEMTLLLLSIRLHKAMRTQLDGDQFKEQLLLEVSAILELVTPNDRKSIASHLGRVVKQMLIEREGRAA